MYEGQEFNAAEITDPSLKTIFEFAQACKEIEKGDLLSIIGKFSAILEFLERPLEGTVSEAMLLGSQCMPALDCALGLFKSKMPKKQNTEINSQMSLPLREAIKSFTTACEAV